MSTKMGTLERLLRQFLGVPTFYKALLANVVVVTAGAVAGTWITARHIGGEGEFHGVHWEIIALIALAGIPVAFFVNFAVLSLAFAPLRSLLRAMELVREGRIQVRVHRGLISDPDTDEMVDTFNEMLDKLAASQQRLEALAAKVVAAQEDERRRLSRELHDGTAQAITSVMLALSAIKRSRDMDEVVRRVEEAEVITKDVAEEIRRTSLELRPLMLDDLGLVPALQWYLRQSRKVMKTSLEFHCHGLKERLPPTVEIALYRLVQEAITNIAKHAEATRASVTLEGRDHSVVVTIEDDGRGFDLQQVLGVRERGLGLFGMQERVSVLGGTLEIDSRPGAGTRIVAEVPFSISVRDGVHG